MRWQRRALSGQVQKFPLYVSSSEVAADLELFLCRHVGSALSLELCRVPLGFSNRVKIEVAGDISSAEAELAAFAS